MDYRQYFCVKLRSLPWWGVWVEISQNSHHQCGFRVTPFAGVWIEMNLVMAVIGQLVQSFSICNAIYLPPLSYG